MALPWVTVRSLIIPFGQVPSSTCTPVSHVQRFFLTTIWALQVPLAAANKINAANLVIDVFMSKAHDAPRHQIRPSQIEKSVRSLTESGLTWNASSGARRKAL